MSWRWGRGMFAICSPIIKHITMAYARTLRSTRMLRSVDHRRQSVRSHQSHGSAASIVNTLGWLNWGTTQALRHVTSVSDAFPDEPAAPAPDEAVFRVTFWSADWTPWRALAQLAARWPTLRFAVRPSYDAA